MVRGQEATMTELLQEILAFRSTWEVQGLNSVRQLFSFYGCNLGSLNFFKHWSHAKVDWNLISATSHRDGCDRLVRLVVSYIYIYIRVFTVSIPSSSSRYGNSSHMDCPMILPYFSQWTPSGNATWQQRRFEWDIPQRCSIKPKITIDSISHSTQGAHWWRAPPPLDSSRPPIEINCGRPMWQSMWGNGEQWVFYYPCWGEDISWNAMYIKVAQKKHQIYPWEVAVPVLSRYTTI